MNRQGVREHFVYTLYAADGVCLYVGMTRSPERRWKQHRRNRPQMVSRVSERRMSGPYLIEVARCLERELQDDLQPVFDGRITAMRTRRRSLARVQSA